MSKTGAVCPNCNSPVRDHQENGCVLAALTTVLRDRGEHSARKLQSLHANCDADALWNDVGRIVDKLGEGGYSSRK